MRRAFTLIELLVVVAIVVILISFIGGGGVWIAEAFWHLIAGWCYFIGNKLPRVEPRTEAVLTGLLALLLMVGLLHLLMRRLVNRPATDALPARDWTVRATASLVSVIVLLFAAGVSAIGVTHQSLWMFTSDEPLLERKGRGSANTYSQNNLRQMGVAFHNYEEKHKQLPLPGTSSPDGRMLHSWQTQLLPYLEREELYRSIDLNKPWDDPVNRPHFVTDINLFYHPGVFRDRKDRQGYAITSYAANVRAFSIEQPMRFSDYPRGISNTIFAGEAAGNYKPWGHPLNVRDPRLGLHRTPDGFGGPRPGRTQFLMADGSVRTFTDDADPEFLELIGGR